MYELRLFALEQLSGMRADIFLCDSHRMVVTGPTPLRGRHLDTRDLRSGMALIAAALAAEGESVVGPLETVERGYAQVVERLTGLGASSRERVNSEEPAAGVACAAAASAGRAARESPATAGTTARAVRRRRRVAAWGGGGAA